MSEPSPPAADLPEPTDVRFSIRALLFTMVVVAVIAAAIGPYFRRLAPENRIQIGSMWGIATILVGLWIGYQMRNRLRLEKAAGRTLLELPPRGNRFKNVQPWVRYAGGLLLIALGPLYLLISTPAILSSRNVPPPIYSYIFPSFISAMVVGNGIAIIWWNRAVQLREQGVLYGLRLLRWDHVTSCRWIVDAAILDGLDQVHNDVRFQMNVPAKLRVAAERIFAERLGQSPAFHDSLALSPMTAAIPKFRVNTPGEVRTRGCLIAFLAYVIGVMFFGLGFSYQPREFQFGGFAGFAVAAFYVRLQSRRRGQGGAPRVRLKGRTDWGMMAAIFIPAALGYYVSSQLAFSFGWLAATIGAYCGAAFFLTVAQAWSDNLDLCENGVVVWRWMYWPWQKIRVREWNPDGDGGLVLGRGWIQAIAVVPPSLREEVDALLKEKVTS